MTHSVSADPVALVTGAGGFAGSWLVRRLADSGRQVHCASLSGSSPSDEQAPALAGMADSSRARLVWHALDVSAEAAVDALMEQVRPEEIYHLAGVSRPGDQRTGLFYDVHVKAVVALGDAIKAHAPAARLLIVGSAYQYGRYDRAIREIDPCVPLNHYGASKTAGEVVGMMLARDGVDVVCVRPFNHSGPGQSPDFVLPTLIEQLAQIKVGEGEPVVQLGGVDSVRDFCDVRDVVELYILAMEQAASGQIYNVGSGSGLRIGDLYDLVISVTGMDMVRLEVRSGRVGPDPLPTLVADVSRAEEELGWTAQIPLGTTIADMFEHQVALRSSAAASGGSGLS